MKCRFLRAILLLSISQLTSQEEVRLIDLDPQDAQQIIEHQDTSLKYAPKIESNVPAVRYLGNKPHNVAEDIYLANQYHGQDGLGGYLYGYSVPDIAKTEKKKAGGDLRGAYNYIAGNGQEIKVEYWDDGTGFHQIDNVPKNLPEDLPEVKKAKEEFMRIWHEQAERNKHPVQDPYNSEGQYKEGPLSKQGQLFRQQQFAAQFGPTPNYQGPSGYQTSASQQSSVYQSNFEKIPQTNNPNYQPYQGRDQQNQGAYQSKQFTSATKGPSYVWSSSPGVYQGNQGQASLGFGKANTGGLSGFGQVSQGTVGGGYGANAQAQAQAHASIHGQGSVDNAESNAGSSSGYVKGNIGSQNQGYSGYEGHSVASGSGNQWNQAVQKTAGHQFPNTAYQTQYQGQSSQNVNKYAPQPQPSSYGSQTSDYGSKTGGNEDDGQYHEENEEKGPPKGFFYKFDYPVGIIVSKQGPAQEGGHQGGAYHSQHKEPGAY